MESNKIEIRRVKNEGKYRVLVDDIEIGVYDTMQEAILKWAELEEEK